MEPISFTLDMLERVIRIVEDLKDRYQKMKKTPKQCEELGTLLIKIKSRLVSIKPEDLPEDLQGFLQDAKDDFSEAETKLEDLRSKIPSPTSFGISAKMKALFKAKEWSGDLQNLVTKYAEIYKHIMRLASAKGLAGEVRRVGRTVQKVEEKVDGLTVAPGASGSADDKSEKFKPNFNVPPLPADLTLSPDNQSSPEGMLKAKLLAKVAGVVSAVSRSPIAIGMGGVGKTCALKRIGQDEEIQQCFKDGVYWLQLGQEATDTLAVQRVGEIVRQSGGVELSKKIEGIQDVDRAAREAGEWFAGHCCLFLCDDLWCTASRPQGYFHVLKSLVDEKSGSRMVCSTRDRDIAKLAGVKHQVEFSARQTEEAELIILKCSGFTLPK